MPPPPPQDVHQRSNDHPWWMMDSQSAVYCKVHYVKCLLEQQCPSHLHNGHKSADVVLFDIIIIMLHYFIIVTIVSLPRVINDLPLYRILCLSLFSLSLSLPRLSLESNELLFCDDIRQQYGFRGSGLNECKSMPLLWLQLPATWWRSFFLYWQEIRGCVSVGWNTNQSIGGDNQGRECRVYALYWAWGAWNKKLENPHRKQWVFDGHMDGWHWHKIGDKWGDIVIYKTSGFVKFCK